MIISLLICLPIIGITLIIVQVTYDLPNINKVIKFYALLFSLIELILSLIAWLLFDTSSPYYQFVQEQYEINNYNFYLGIDGLSIYFILLTTFMVPISIVSNWKSINEDKVIYFLICLLLLESLLIIVFTALDGLIFYIFFESILAPLFVLINMFGSKEKGRASFYFFLYTFLGSLYMLLSIISIESSMGTTDFNIIYTSNYYIKTQILFFIGIIVAFAVKTPVIFLNGWLLKAHVESPLSGSIMLAAVVLKLSLYGIFRLILPLLPKGYLNYTYLVFVIGVITVIYASLSTLRTIDIKEIIAYSSVSHAAVYFCGGFSNIIQGIQGSILLAVAHGLVSAGLFFSVGGILYDRANTRLISVFNGLAQPMPIFATLFFMFCLGNCGAPLTLNFIGEFMSMYGVFARLPLSGILLSISIVLSAAFTILMYNRICFGGKYFEGLWYYYVPDLNLRENYILSVLILYTIILGIYPSILLDTEYHALSLNFSIDEIDFGGKIHSPHKALI